VPPPSSSAEATEAWSSLGGNRRHDHGAGGRPSGTANLRLGSRSPSDIKEIVGVIARGDRRSIDTAVCNGRTFNVMAGTGFDVAMLADAEESKGGSEHSRTSAAVAGAASKDVRAKVTSMETTSTTDRPAACWSATAAR
jgi:diacylglycerol kinase family enzyme